MNEFPFVQLLTEFGLKPAEVLVLIMLWQNIKGNRVLLDKLVEKVHRLEVKLGDRQCSE
ncbi:MULTISPECIES: hypothetical protein [Vibrio]|uniref:Uncharacterized protein n=1 Tax=Vibrio kanaloae TaxID=170673 RepID=A0ABV4LLE5_9VIBR|nr:hypothetical protein [Vibrio kanaloae]